MVWRDFLPVTVSIVCCVAHEPEVLCLNSLRPSDAIWRQWFWTTLAQVMACCLTAPSHYLNQCWLIIRGVLWHTSESSFAGIAQGIDSGYEFEKDILKNIFKSPRGQWVNARACLLSIAKKVSLSERRHCVYNILSHWFRPCSGIHRLKTCPDVVRLHVRLTYKQLQLACHGSPFIAEAWTKWLTFFRQLFRCLERKNIVIFTLLKFSFNGLMKSQCWVR